MHLRADALVAASRMVIEIQQLALAGEDYSVATVGKMTVEPGAMNVVPSKVQFTVDIRCAKSRDIQRIQQGIHDFAQVVQESEGVEVELAIGDDGESRPFDPGVMTTIREAILEEGLPLWELWSGAGHDANPAALLWPTGMIFVRSKDGLSHAEAEYSSPEDIAAATAVLYRTTIALANPTNTD